MNQESDKEIFFSVYKMSNFYLTCSSFDYFRTYDDGLKVIPNLSYYKFNSILFYMYQLKVKIMR